MKKVITTVLTLLVLLVADSCKKDEVESKVNANGLTREITDLVPQSILDEMKRLGMPINGGATPPLLTQGKAGKLTYLARPFILKNSNRVGDKIGDVYPNYNVSFYEQDNNKLTVKVDYVNGAESGSGLGSYIVGNDCKFSVFVELDVVHTNGTKAKTVSVISGALLPDKIEGLYLASFMLDDYGDPQNVWIEVGEGRIFYDSDGFSEVVGSNATWYSHLPACPCTYTEVQRLSATTCPEGIWTVCGSADQDFHYGATTEARWWSTIDGKAGQQCTYDATGKLITGGIAAGSPDRASPRNCGFWAWLTSGAPAPGTTLQNFLDHKSNDIDTWKAQPCWQYLTNWPANNGAACGINVVSGISNNVNGIDNLNKMIGNMTCEEATLLIKSAKQTTPPVIDANLRSYILGAQVTLTAAECKIQLQTWKGNIICATKPALCDVLDEAVNNM